LAVFRLASESSDEESVDEFSCCGFRGAVLAVAEILKDLSSRSVS
jgi:hypothetical protein